MEKSSGGGGYRPSRGKLIIVHCGHCEGKPAILLQGLKRHTERVHGKGVAPLLKGEKQVETQAHTIHSVLNQGFLYTNFDFFYKTSQTVLLVLTFIDMMFEQEAVPVS